MKCPGCGKTMPPGKVSEGFTYCSTRCMRRHQEELRTKAGVEKEVETLLEQYRRGGDDEDHG
jgi:hypothetical protein